MLDASFASHAIGRMEVLSLRVDPWARDTFLNRTLGRQTVFCERIISTQTTLNLERSKLNRDPPRSIAVA